VQFGIGLALERAEADPGLRVVIITSAGDEAFCAGADLKAISRGERIEPDDEQRQWGFAGMVRHPISKPVIAAVNGFALGGGTEIALASDLIIAAEHAQFGLPEVKRGLFAAAGGVFRLTDQVPIKQAMEYLLTGEPFSSQRALELGFANRVVPLSDLMATSLDLADRIAKNAPLSVQASKRLAMGIHQGKIASDDAFWEANKREARLVMRSQDAREGPLAFAQKRTPTWQVR
jgi:crotonobetainyl-CoA hydratase